MNEEYPDSDFPYTFYFNGTVMPKWTSCWSYIPITFKQDWIGYLCWLVKCRIDHVGVIESEDSEIMQICVNQCLYALLEHKDKILADLTKFYPDEDSQEIMDSMISGLLLMGEIITTTPKVAWTNGYDSDLQKLNGMIDQEPQLYPHEIERRSEMKFEVDSSLKQLRRYASNNKVPKNVRKYAQNQLA
jgi:hypothetical protein